MGVLHLHLKVVGETESVGKDVKTATQDIERRGIVRSAEASDSPVVNAVDNVMRKSGQGDLYKALEGVVAKLDVLIGIIDKAFKVGLQSYAFYSLITIATRSTHTLTLLGKSLRLCTRCD